MARKITARNLFKPQPSKSESKAQATDRAYREILTSEANARMKKSQKLRRARLRQEQKAQD